MSRFGPSERDRRKNNNAMPKHSRKITFTVWGIISGLFLEKRWRTYLYNLPNILCIIYKLMLYYYYTKTL